MMTTRWAKRLTSALILELVLVAGLAGFGAAFPRDVAAGEAWRFLAAHGYALAHAVLGGLVLVQAAALGWSRRGPASTLLALGVAVSVAAGLWYVSGRQPDAALTVMTAGWLLGLGAAVALRIALRRTKDGTR